MPDPLGLFLIFLLPLALILFMTRNFGKRLRHPHDLLAASGAPRFARLFFRQLRSRYDLLFDLCIALVLAFALRDDGGPILPAKTGAAALVIDCSRSMFAGIPGSRPIDIALAALNREPALAAADRFALFFDPSSRQSRLIKWESLAKTDRIADAASRGAAVDNVISSVGLFSVDYRRLTILPARGYRDISLLTDSFPLEPRGFRVLETGFPGQRRRLGASSEAASLPDKAGAAPASEPARGQARSEGRIILGGVDEDAPEIWPSGCRLDRGRSAWLLSFTEAGRRTTLSIDALDRATGDFSAFPTTGYAIEEGKAGRRLVMPEAGEYRFVFSDPAGGIPLVFAVNLGPAETAASASGAFSELVRKALPYLVERPRPSIVLSDGKAPVKAGEMGASARIPTALVTTAPFVADPGLLGGRPIAAGYLEGLSFAWASASLANPDIPLAYDAAIREAARPPFTTSFPADRPIKSAGPGAWLVAGDVEGAAIDAPASEYFEPVKSGSLELRVPPRPWLWVALLAALAIGKYLVWRLRKAPSR